MSSEYGSLLVVDDNEMNRDMLSRRLQRKGYTVTLAEDGAGALELIAAERFDLVLLDVMMPGIDGLTVLERVRQVHSVADLPIIMTTAKDRSEDVVRALEIGANDYVTKPLDFPVVLARVRTHLSLKRANTALEMAHARMKRDLEAAAKIQQALIPTSPPAVDGVSFSWVFEPCDELAGDILDVFHLDEKLVGLYLLDVSGHGVPSALLSVTLSRLLSHMADESLLKKGRDSTTRSIFAPPAEVALELNRRFPMDEATRQYFTFLYGILNLESHEFRYVSAGHPGPVHLGREGEPVFFDSSGFPVGWFPNLTYDETSITLERGDRLYFYSDGVIEAKNSREELFGKQGLVNALDRGRAVPLEDSLRSLMLRVREWCGDCGPDDDISLLALEIAY